MKVYLPVFFSLCLLTQCTGKNDITGLKTKAIQEIHESEKAFEKMAADKSIAEAFWYYADSNATIKRQNDSLIHGKEQIRNYYSAPLYQKVKLTWSPDFVDVSDNGDLGYSYGKYTWQSTDSNGQTNEARGVFHTVWKKQDDGSWKYVWD